MPIHSHSPSPNIERHRLAKFVLWLELKHPEAKDVLDEVLESINDNQETLSPADCEKILQTSFQNIPLMHESYMEQLRTDHGALSSFWMSYVDMVELMLNMIRASREGNWPLHLASVRDMIPWCFAYDHLNYARYMPVYYGDMCSLAQTHPEAYEFLINGGFSVQIGAENPFGRIPVDQTVEETVNKDTQTSGGTKGFSLKSGALTRHYMTAEYRSSFLRIL